MKFIEVDGMILLAHLDPKTGQVETERRNDRKPTVLRWQYERGANHIHTRMSAPDREHVNDELELAAEFIENLRSAHPDRTFVVTHMPCYAVSFYQPVDDAPTSGTLPVEGERRLKGEAFCVSCQTRQKILTLPPSELDPPMTEWAKCEVCGAEVLTYYEEIFTLIAPSI